MGSGDHVATIDGSKLLQQNCECQATGELYPANHGRMAGDAGRARAQKVAHCLSAAAAGSPSEIAPRLAGE